jgi:hypothetical protein
MVDERNSKMSRGIIRTGLTFALCVGLLFGQVDSGGATTKKKKKQTTRVAKRYSEAELRDAALSYIPRIEKATVASFASPGNTRAYFTPVLGAAFANEIAKIPFDELAKNKEVETSLRNDVIDQKVVAVSSAGDVTVEWCVVSTAVQTAGRPTKSVAHGPDSLSFCRNDR